MILCPDANIPERLSGSVSGSGLKSDIPTLSDVRSPGTIIGVNSGSDHVVSSKRFLPERLINRERGNEGRQSERETKIKCAHIAKQDQ